jgi:hypothetical protein
MKSAKKAAFLAAFLWRYIGNLIGKASIFSTIDESKGSKNEVGGGGVHAFLVRYMNLAR